MGNTYSKIYIHLIFSTKHREPLILPQFEERLKSYISGIAKQLKINILAVNGMQDHIHLLLILVPTVSLSEAVQHFKGASSRWLNQNFFEDSSFRWQKGYGAFSINESLVPATIQYIQNQKQHHANLSFTDEFEAILRKHRVSKRKR